MKTTQQIFVFLSILVLASSIVTAVEPSVTPSHPFYTFKLGWEKMTELFKPSLKTVHAQERLLELEVEQRKGNAQDVEKLIKRVREAQEKGLLKSEDVDKAEKQFNEKFTINYEKLKEAINKDAELTAALKQYKGRVALFVKYPGDKDKNVLLVVDENGKVTSMSEVTSVDSYDYYFNLSHGQLYAYSQQIINEKGRDLTRLLKVGSLISNKDSTAKKPEVARGGY